MSITTTSATTTPPATTAGTSATQQTQAGGSLDKNAFLQLMMTQLKNQDPLNPSDPTQYTAELAQFTSLEQETNIAQTMTTVVGQQQASTALSLLGDTVTYVDADGNAVSGAVQKVDFSSAVPTLTIGGVDGVSLGSITGVS